MPLWFVIVVSVCVFAAVLAWCLCRSAAMGDVAQQKWSTHGQEEP